MQRSWCRKELHKGGRLRADARFIRHGGHRREFGYHSKCNKKLLKSIRTEYSVSIYVAVIWRRLIMEAGRPVWRW